MNEIRDDKRKLVDSIKALEHALRFKKEADKDQFYFFGISKSFEVCLEYAWKYLKKKVQEEGFEVYSPKEAIKYAGKMKLIDNVEKWLDFLKDRNMAVHDYLGVSDETYLETIEDFLTEVKMIK